MDTKLYLTIAAIVAILYGIGFVLIPAEVGTLYGVKPEPNAILNLRFCGSATLAWGVILWFARDFRDWAAVRGVLIGSVVGLVLNGIVNIWGTIQGLMNGVAWSTTIVIVLLLLGALYCLSTGSRKPA
jgi:xanthine/uracil permease